MRGIEARAIQASRAPGSAAVQRSCCCAFPTARAGTCACWAWRLLAVNEPKAEEFGLVLKDRRAVIGAVKLNYDANAKQTYIDAIVDGACKPIAWTAEGTPEPSPTLVNQHTTLLLDFGGQTYQWELKPSLEYETELHRAAR
jgi:hypothetical protein